jgi:type I restriction enzyme M protein
VIELVPQDTKLEAETRQEIGAKLEAAGWAVQDKQRIDLTEKPGVAVREMDTDNVLFEGGAGETVRKNLLERCDLHTLLRLPTGIFYAQGVKANVIFFDAKPASKTAWTKKLWVYDFRTNVHMTLKTKRLVKSDFDEFIELYRADDRSKRVDPYSKSPHPDPLPEGEGTGELSAERGGAGRWRSFTYDELVARDKTNLDIFWLKDESLEDTDNLPAPEVLAQEIVEQLEAALEEFRSMEEVLAANNA